jgi:O-antigen ligase
VTAFPARLLADWRSDLPADPSARRRGELPRATYALHLLTIGAIALSNTFLVATLLALPWAWRRDPPDWRRLRRMALPLGVYVLLLAAACIPSSDPRVSFGSLSELLSLTTLLLALLLFRGAAACRLLIDGLIAMAALLALHGLGQLLYGYGGLDQRIRGPFSHWMTFAGVLLICDLLLISRLSFDARSRTAWRWIALAAINLGLLGSLTRSAWTALGVTLIAFLAYRRPRLLLALPPAALLFVVLAPVPLLSRMLSTVQLSDASNYDRLCMLDAGVRMIAERPLFGIGPDMVQQRYPLYRHPAAPRYEVPHLHNDLLQLAAERGLPAAASYVWLTAAAIGLAVARFRKEGGAGGPCADLYMGVILALAGFNLAGLFEFNWGDTEVQRIVLFLLALPSCLEPEAVPAVAGEAPPAGLAVDEQQVLA